MIATPAYGGQVTTTYCDTVISLIDHFREKHPHIRFERKFLSLSALPFARNVFANLVMQDDSFTHLLFVDADMGFAPSLIEHMIAADKPMVGAMSPFRKLELEKLYALHDEIADPASPVWWRSNTSMLARSVSATGHRERVRAAHPTVLKSMAPASASRISAPVYC